MAPIMHRDISRAPGPSRLVILIGLASLSSSFAQGRGIPALFHRDGTDDVPGWPIFYEGSLGGLGLAPDCEVALYREVLCDSNARVLMSGKYDGEEQSEAAAMCTETCSASIQSLHDAVALSCEETPNLMPGMPLIGLVDRLWDNWNQTCFADPETKENCNAVIAAFPEVDDLDDLPDSDVCSYCYTRSLALMQTSAYSASYQAEFFQTQYKYVARRCNLEVADFEPTPSIFNITVDPPKPRPCVSGNTYIAEKGDTCDSIAKAHMVSAATLFYTNANLLDCASVEAGSQLCLPLACERLREVEEGDTCTSIAVDAGLGTQDIVAFNPQLNRNCTNLHDPDPNWGSIICVSTPGGSFHAEPASSLPVNGGRGGGSGYGATQADPPRGATVAPDTTLLCGSWYTWDGALQCVQICLSNSIPINLLAAANPSLQAATCDRDLVRGATYCVAPLAGFESPLPASTLAPAMPKPSGFPVRPIPVIIG